MHFLRLLLLGGSLYLCGLGLAAETPAAPVDPTGTWKWSVTVGGGQTIEAQLRLRWLDGKLSGVAIGPDREELPLEKLEFKDGQLRFEVTRQVQSRRFKTVYTGTVRGDRIVGKAGTSAARSARSLPWEAVRVIEQPTPPPKDVAPASPPAATPDS